MHMDYENEYRQPPAPVAATITANIDADYLIGAVAEQVKREVTTKLDGRIEESIELILTGAAASAAESRIKAATEELLAQGFKQTDDYGRERPPKTLKDMVAEALSKALGERDHYNSRRTKIETMLDDAIKQEIGKMLREETERAREVFRRQVDAVVQAKLGEALRSALGLP